MPAEMPKALDFGFLGTDIAATHDGIIAGTARIRAAQPAKCNQAGRFGSNV
jgi:hypothetical protein